MSQITDAALLEWQPVRPEVTQGVFGKTLMEDGVKVVLTRVAAGGEFRTHRDKFGHLFYFLSGSGSVRVNDAEFPAKPGSIVRVMPGESHTYANTGTEDLMLISINLPDK